MKLLKQATYVKYVLTNLSKFVQISTQTFRISFYREFFENKKGLEQVSRPYFSYNFLKKNFACNVT